MAVGISLGGEVETLEIGCDPGTRFRIASITKPFTATLALELLDLEASTGVWTADVRVRHLLSHTSGYDAERGDLTRFGEGDDALEAMVALGPYALGAEVTLADICLVPQVANARRFKVPLDRFPKIVAIDAACAKLVPFDQARPENQPDAE